MPKNTKGGSGHKKAASKHFKTFNHKTRYALDDKTEIYAQVMHVFGHGMFDASCIDGKTRKGIIRGKFRGKNKSANRIEKGTIVLMGVRDYQSKDDVCDLLEVYGPSAKNDILNTLTAEQKTCLNQFKTNSDVQDTDNEVEFSNESQKTEEYNELIQNITNNTSNTKSATQQPTIIELDDEDDNIDIDDI